MLFLFLFLFLQIISAQVITGAGMMSIPRAFAFIGWLPGTLMLLGVAGLTYFTLAVLVQGTQSFNAPTYPRLVLVTCGRSTAKLLQVAVLAFLFGFNVVYLVSKDGANLGHHGLPQRT
jgi:amino acid permease